jgi:hypothetical protein
MKLREVPLLRSLLKWALVPRQSQNYFNHDFTIRLNALERQAVSMRLALGRIEARQVGAIQNGGGLLLAKEFQVFSQSGEDGIIQHLVGSVPIANKIFVEFGVEDYAESNTRFLLVNNHWTGFVMDSSEANIEKIKASGIHWSNELRCSCEFITCENVDAILARKGLPEEIGLLSIDIDGNDYWVWQAIKCIRPAIVVIEYNFRFGPEASVTIPYRPDFERRKAHPRMIYFGASLAALCKLGERKGYDFVGSTSNGVNAFFVRKDLRPDNIPVGLPSQEWRRGKHAEGCGLLNERSFVPLEEEMRELLRMPLVEV